MLSAAQGLVRHALKTPSYAQEHKWDPQGREARFPKTVSIPEGAAFSP